MPPVVVKPPLAFARIQATLKLVVVVVGAVAGQWVIVPAGEPHQTLPEPQLAVPPASATSTALTAPAAAASAALWAASRRKYPQPTSATRLIMPSITVRDSVIRRTACPPRFVFLFI